MPAVRPRMKVRRRKVLSAVSRALAASMVALCLLGFSCLLPAIPRAECQSPATEGREVVPEREADAGALVKEWPGRNKRFALVIGVDSYREFRDLKGAVNDARLIAALLKKYADFPDEQVELMTSDQTDEALKPTKTNILTWLDKLKGRIPPDGMLLISFAGHGVEGSDGQTYLLTQDARMGSPALLFDTALSLATLKNYIVATGVKQVVLILDSCRTVPGRRATEGTIMPEAMPRAINFDVTNKEVKAFVTLFATSPGHSAYEDAKSKHGYFTLELANALEGAAADDRGFVTLGSLVRHLEDRVPPRVREALGQKQMPFSAGEGFKADELVIAHTSPVLDLRTLASGRPLEKPLSAGDVQSFHLKPPARNFVSLEVEPRGLNLNTAVFSPDNAKLYETDEPEPLMLLSGDEAYYRLEVRALKEGLTKGFYSIRAMMRPASLPDDSNRMAAQHAVLAARGLLNMRRYPAALKKFEEALNHWRLAQDKAGEAKALRDIGRVYELSREPGKALEHYQQALGPLREVGDRNGLATVYTLIGRIHLADNDKARALAALEEVLAVLQPRPVGMTTGEEFSLNLFDPAFSAFHTEKLILSLKAITEFEGLSAKKYRTPQEELRFSELRPSGGAKVNIIHELFHTGMTTAATLRELGPGTVALYTLVGEQDYKVILITPDVSRWYSYAIPRVELNRKVAEFRQALQSPGQDPRPLAKELYDILVKPLEDVLRQADARTLLWSLDGTLRYLPVGALFDGERYMVERYQNVNVTPRSLSSMSTASRPPGLLTRALGLGVSKPAGEFPALPGVAEELRAIVGGGGAAFPGRILLDESFTKANMRDALRQRYPLIHLSTHGSFVPGDPDASFLLLGDGSRLTLKEFIDTAGDFRGVELLVLTVCNTALVGEADGREVEGFPEVAQRLGARSVLAGLWSPNDESRKELMGAFFRNLRTGVPKDEALRRAQVEMLRRRVFSHPYYWASFVLFGDPR